MYADDSVVGIVSYFNMASAVGCGAGCCTVSGVCLREIKVAPVFGEKGNR